MNRKLFKEIIEKHSHLSSDAINARRIADLHMNVYAKGGEFTIVKGNEVEFLADCSVVKTVDAVGHENYMVIDEITHMNTYERAGNEEAYNNFMSKLFGGR